MFFSRQKLVLSPDVQIALRITVPWYEPFDVETKYFGTYRIQLSSILVDGATVIQIAGVPVRSKHTPAEDPRTICGLSGVFETQVEAIRGWEEGFVVTALEDGETAPLADAIVKYMIKKKQAVVVHAEAAGES